MLIPISILLVLDVVFEENGDAFCHDCVELLLDVLNFSCGAKSQMEGWGIPFILIRASFDSFLKPHAQMVKVMTGALILICRTGASIIC